MEKNNNIGTDLFNKIRGRFSNVIIGDADGNVVSDPKEARFFEFEYTSNGLKIGKVSVNVNEDELTVIYSKDLLSEKSDIFKDEWYEFLKELRKFAKKRLLQFDVRDINKTNLTKRDYESLAKQTRSGEDNMNESKLYGTAHTSYQRVDNARIVIKHNSPINTESAAGRTQHISAIYIESAEGERFKYPYKHLSGARAMARHVSEGGKQYDDFGSHIVSLSEELHKLRKFKSYMGKSNVMAESLAEYVDVVNGRIVEVKKTIERLHKPAYYKEAIDGFEKPILEDVPADVADSWIDQLTIKQFNEELKDVFPYIYRLVGEAKRAETVTLEDIVDEAKPCWKGYKQIGMKEKRGRKVPNCVPEEIELEQAFESMLGQFAEAEEPKKKVDEASSDETSRRPLVKFVVKKLPNDVEKIQAIVNPVAQTSSAFKRNSADSIVFNVTPPGVNPDGKIYFSLEQMMNTLKRKNNTTGITVVMTKTLENILKDKKYKYISDWLASKPRSELNVIDDDTEGPEKIKIGPVIFVDVQFKNGETRTVEGSRLQVLEYLVDINDKNYDGNPFVQGTPVKLMDKDFEGHGFAQGRDLIKQRTEDPRGVMSSRSLGEGEEGVVVRSRMYKKEQQKFYANQKFKNLVAKVEQPYEKIVVTNTRAFDKIRKEHPNLLSKYFKPNSGIFEVPPKELENFKSVVYSEQFEKSVGDPKLLFLSDVETADGIPDELLKDMPEDVQKRVKGKYSEIDYTDGNEEPAKDVETNTTGPLSVQGFRKLENYLDKFNLRGYLYFTKEEAKQLSPISDAELKTYMEDLMRTRDLKDAKQIAAEILMKQNAFPSERKDRYFDIKNVIVKDSPEAILNFMREWYINMKKHSARPGTPIAAIPGMPAKMPAGTTPPPEPGKDVPQKAISQQSFDRLAELVNDKNVILDYTKEVANDILDKEYKTSALSLNMLKNRINRATSKEQIYNIIVNLEQSRSGNALITKTLRPVIQDINRVKKNPNIRKPFNKSNESKDNDKKSKSVPFTEFIMSHVHIDEDTGQVQIPRGETAVLTMIEKDYGERYIEPAKQFIERLNMLCDEYQMRNHPQKLQDNSGLTRIKSLAGL